MSYAICRMEKMKSHDLKGMQFHNQRERPSRTNPDIDPGRTPDNHDFVNPASVDYNKRVNEIIQKQKTSTRKTRKDAVLVNELVVTSDQDFFRNLSDHERDQFFKESYEFLSERYGKQNIAYAMVHLDEKTPNMHMGVVPMRDGKLQSKNVFDWQELRWMQDAFPKHMKEKGFDVERGREGSDAEHLRPQDYKAKKLEERIGELEDDLEQKQAKRQQADQAVKAVEDRLSDLRKASDHAKRTDDIPVKTSKGLLGSQSVKLSHEDFQGIKSLAKSSEAHRSQNEGLQKRNQKLAKENDRLREQSSKLKKERDQYKNQLELMNKLVGRMRNFYKQLGPKAQQVFEHTLGYCKQQANRRRSPTNELRFDKSQLTADQEKGFNQAVKETKEQKQKQRRRGLER